MNMRITIGCALAVLCLSSSVFAEDLVLNGGSTSLSGIKRYDHVCLINGATLNVDTYAGDKALGGNLELIASTIYVDASFSHHRTRRGLPVGALQRWSGAERNRRWARWLLGARLRRGWRALRSGWSRHRR